MREQNEGIKRAKVYRDPNLQIVFGITLMAVLSVSSITPAFPVIVGSLDISPQDVGLLITVFTFPGVILTPILGVLADRFGRKRILVPALLLFSFTGTLCFFAGDFRLLLLLRFFQGVGGASLGAINVTLIGDLYKGRELTAAMGYNSSVLSLGTAGYPAIGGALAMLGWNYPFLLPAFALPIGLVVMFSLEAPEVRNRQRLRDYFKGTWESLKHHQVVGIILTGTVTFILLYGLMLAYLPFFLAFKFDASPLVIGLVTTTMSISSAAASWQLEKLSARMSERYLIITGLFLYLASALLVPVCGNIWMALIPTLLFGFGNGINIPSLVTILTDITPAEHRGAMMAVNGMVIRLGQTLGPIIMGAVFAAWGIEAVFLAGAVFAILLIAFSSALIR